MNEKILLRNQVRDKKFSEAMQIQEKSLCEPVNKIDFFVRKLGEQKFYRKIFSAEFFLILSPSSETFYSRTNITRQLRRVRDHESRPDPCIRKFKRDEIRRCTKAGHRAG
jgi:hypothetical protein